ncbi:MAG: ATP-binding protein [Yoonia sp.]
MINPDEITELLRVKGKYLYHREGQYLEFKEQFNLAGLADYLRDFAGFANNKGGLLVFGVTDAPRIAAGLNGKALDSFNKLDPERVTGFILDIFSSAISWEAIIVEHEGKHFGAFKVFEADTKPVIARKDEGKDQTIRNGDIYYRYGGRTQRIQSAELESIINRRIEQTNKDWIDMVKQIGPAGPSSAFVIRTTDQVDANKGGAFVVDRGLAEKLKFVKEGQFSEKSGAISLKLVGDVVPVDTVEVEKVIKENLLKDYPYSASDLAGEVAKKADGVGKNAVWKAIQENDLKSNPDYSSYNFRNRKLQQQFEETGKVAISTPSLYNAAAVELLVKLLS